ncbi:hypothetical protein AUEXF2481DRAFT_631205 [Aureobasidium subglaciale EXF-2481]|uniref:Uncharacterized protein n=1 Tax=Aureobasidium subglaciale (strain EXF-2481) TaxID=1043005 RepID=A0A074YHF9_AURSE|nr:uncharacterized protein AUEXF2481DRAFT_631205 [Aureobasidium subglaciale EXF-2481]KEQ97120.1 hypothetical protein AUEXF2481DRAFT_631205 [Aureobasidium subglaciale EXF-2481]
MLIPPPFPARQSLLIYDLFCDPLVPSQARVSVPTRLECVWPTWLALGIRQTPPPPPPFASSTVHEFKLRDGRNAFAGMIRERGGCRFLSTMPNWVWWFLLLLALLGCEACVLHDFSLFHLSSIVKIRVAIEMILAAISDLATSKTHYKEMQTRSLLDPLYVYRSLAASMKTLAIWKMEERWQ